MPKGVSEYEAAEKHEWGDYQCPHPHHLLAPLRRLGIDAQRLLVVLDLGVILLLGILELPGEAQRSEQDDGGSEDQQADREPLHDVLPSIQ